MNKRKAIISAVCSVSIFGIAGGILASTGNSVNRLVAQGNDPEGGYHLVLNADVNNPLIEGNALADYKAKTKERGNDILISFNSVESDSVGSLVTLKHLGTIENTVNQELKDKNKISGIKSIKVVYNSDHPLEARCGWSKISDNLTDFFQIESGVETQILGSPSYFRLIAIGTTEIKSIEINYSCHAGADYNVDIDYFDISNSDVVGVDRNKIPYDQTKLVFPKYAANKELKSIHIEERPGEGPGEGPGMSPMPTFPSSVRKFYIPNTYTQMPVGIFQMSGGDLYFEGTKPASYYMSAKAENYPYSDFLAL